MVQGIGKCGFRVQLRPQTIIGPLTYTWGSRINTKLNIAVQR